MKRKRWTVLAVFAMVVALLPLSAVPAAAGTGPSVFINEIHYDNDSTDAGEAIEVAGPAGTNLTGWSIVLYNGNGGASYNTTALSGVLADAGSGYGFTVLTYPTNGLQNGAPDGIALVNGSSVVQFLSYEGSFAAINGPASGMTSTDIGVSESSSTAEGESLQLTGTGTTYDDFAWSGPMGATFGAINTGQVFGSVAAATVVINEIMQNPSAVFDSAGEWFELYNATDSPIDIDGWTIKDDDSDSHVIDNGGPLVVPAGGYLVLGNNANAATNGGASVDYSYGAGWFLSNGADEVILLDSDLKEIDRVEYDGGATFPDPNGASMSVIDPLVDNNVGSNWCTSTTPFGDGDLGTPGGLNNCTDPLAACGAEFTPIYDIQGDGDASPLVGQTVWTEGVVTGDFQLDSEFNGFYLQDPTGDGNTETSDGIFVYQKVGWGDVEVGQHLRFKARVSEFNDLTELGFVDSLTVCATGESVTPMAVSLPVTETSDWEKYEGMLVTFTQPLFITEFFNFDRFGEIVLAPQRLYQPSNIYDPGSPEAAALAAAIPLARITLDDGRSDQNPDPARHPNGGDFTLANRFRGGDTLTNVTGVVDYAFGKYKIQPTTGANYEATNPRPSAAPNVGGTLRVASANVLNFFTHLDNGHDDICGPTGDQECRGADTPEEFQRQLDKIIAEIRGLNADVVGLEEVENDIRDDEPGAFSNRKHDPILTLVEALNDIEGSGTWAWAGEANYYNDYPVRNEIIYRTATVTPVGDPIAYQDEAFDKKKPGSATPVGRPPLAQTFVENASGGVFTVVTNHFKSKGSSCDAFGDLEDPYQANCNLTRVAQSEALLDFVGQLQADTGDPDVLIMGDLNSYAKEDPIDVLVGAGFTNLHQLFEGTYAYSYVFDGQLGYLDHALANPSMLLQVTGTAAWHINADEPDILNYDMSYKKPAQDALYEPNEFRASDHDPVIVGLDLTPITVDQLEALVSFYADTGAITGNKTVKILLDRLERARRYMERDKTAAYKAQLQAFMNQVQGFAPKFIDQSAADVLSHEAWVLMNQ